MHMYRFADSYQRLELGLEKKRRAVQEELFIGKFWLAAGRRDEILLV